MHGTTSTGLTVCLGDALKSPYLNAAQFFLNGDSANVVCLHTLGLLYSFMRTGLKQTLKPDSQTTAETRQWHSAAASCLPQVWCISALGPDASAPLVIGQTEEAFSKGEKKKKSDVWKVCMWKVPLFSSHFLLSDFLTCLIEPQTPTAVSLHGKNKEKRDAAVGCSGLLGCIIFDLKIFYQI